MECTTYALSLCFQNVVGSNSVGLGLFISFLYFLVIANDIMILPIDLFKQFAVKLNLNLSEFLFLLNLVPFLLCKLGVMVSLINIVLLVVILALFT